MKKISSDLKEKTKNKEEIDPKKIHVKLKPLFGLHPRWYLLFIVLVILIIIFFGRAFIAPTSPLIIKSHPSKAQIFIDGKLVGATPLTINAKIGNRNIVLKKSFFKTLTIKKHIPVSWFLGYFIPRKRIINEKMTFEKALLYQDYWKTQIQNWSFVGPIISKKYPFPPLWEDMIDNLQDNSKAILKNFSFSLPYISNSILYEKFQKAYLHFLNIKKYNLSDSQFQNHFYQNLKNHFDKKNLFAFLPWFYDIQNKKTQNLLDETPWFLKLKKQWLAKLAHFKTYSLPNTFSPQYLPHLFYNAFIAVRGENLLVRSSSKNNTIYFQKKDSYPYPQVIHNFYISKNFINKLDFQKFLQENPFWSLNNKKILLEKQLVDNNYLSNFSTLSSVSPVVYISYYAAKAYTLWLSKKYQISIRLPSEAQWELATKKKIINRFRTAHSQKNLWTFTRNNYTPFSGLLSDSHSLNPLLTPIIQPPYPQKALVTQKKNYIILKGGLENLHLSPINAVGKTKSNFCSPFVGMRIVLQ